MSLFKKFADGLSDDLGRLGLGLDKNRDERRDEAQTNRDNVAGQHPPSGQYPPQGYQGYQRYGQPNPQPYPDRYQSSLQLSQGDYYPPPQQQHFSSPSQTPYAHTSEPGPRLPPLYTPPADKPPIPSGWTPRWDDYHQRWYYVEDATGQPQWEAPGFDHSAYRGYVGDDPRGNASPAAGYPGYDGGSPAGYPPYGSEYASQQPGGYNNGRDKNKDNKSYSGMLIGAAGGLAVGAVAGAAIAHESAEGFPDGEHHAALAAAAAPDPAPAEPIIYQTTNNYYSGGDPQSEYIPPPGVLPAYNAYGEEIDGSDRESLRSARDAYEEALEDTASSSASGSDREEVEEAREEYEEEYEETYYDE